MEGAVQEVTVRQVGFARLLDVVPELADGLSEKARTVIRDRARVAVLDISPGPWEPDSAVPGLLAYIVVSGFLLRRVTIAETAACEVLGPGDLLRPHDDPTAFGLIPARAGLAAIGRVRVAVLDYTFLPVLARCPQLLDPLLSRPIARARSLVALAAIGHMKRVDDRLVALFSHLASAHGNVRPEGIVIDIPLSHEQIGDLVGCERPSVTTSLGRLKERGVLVRRPDRSWLLSTELVDTNGNGNSARERAALLSEQSQALTVEAHQAVRRSRVFVAGDLTSRPG
jgi:CRP/FNR family cyclic AMP-dependent transcriptional regulator